MTSNLVNLKIYKLDRSNKNSKSVNFWSDAGGDLKFDNKKTHKSQYSIGSNAVGDFKLKEKKNSDLSQADDLSS